MYRYSFVLVDTHGMHSDTQVGELPSLERALQLAEVITQELSSDPDHRWAGWTLEVHDMQGQVLAVKPVPSAAA